MENFDQFEPQNHRRVFVQLRVFEISHNLSGVACGYYMKFMFLALYQRFFYLYSIFPLWYVIGFEPLDL